MVRVKIIFNFADTLLRTATKSVDGQDPSIISHLLLLRIHTGWQLLAACCSLDHKYLKDFLPRLTHFCSNVFPRSTNDFQQEQKRGDALTWTLSLNQRADLLCSMIAILKSRSNLLKTTSIPDDFQRKISSSIESAILILHHLPSLIKHFGSSLKGAGTTFRLRLYQLLIEIPIDKYQQYFTVLLKALTTDFTLPDSSFNGTTTLLKSISHDKEHFLLGKNENQLNLSEIYQCEFDNFLHCQIFTEIN